MNEKDYTPKTLLEAIRYFSDPDVALRFVADLRWPNGVECPHCGSKDVRFISTRRTWECKTKHPHRQFSVKVGTIFEDSPLGLDKWLAAIWMLANDKNGISSYEIHRGLGITQKSAWFMLHRIRLAMKVQSFDKLTGEVEVDESLIGGRESNKHSSKRRHKAHGSVGKAIVQGVLERGGNLRTLVVPNQKRLTLQAGVREHVKPGETVYTDKLRSYDGLSLDYIHQMVDHTIQYVSGRCHTNGLENYWSLLKRAINGTYVAVEAFHLFRYLDEQTFRFNQRKADDAWRFKAVVRSIFGRRLTYAELTQA